MIRDTAELLRKAWRLVRAGGARLVWYLLLSQLVLLGIALPVIGWLFREALRAGGMMGLDLAALGAAGSLTLTSVLLVALIAVAFWVLALQFTGLVVLLRWPRLSWREFAGQLGRVARKLLRPSSLSLVFYLFLLVPLTGFGFTSVLTRGIAIPQFVSGELLKSTSTTVGLFVFLAALMLLNLRLALTVPVFVLTEGGRAARSSWRLTKGPRASLPLVGAVLTLLLMAGAATVALLIAAIVPTALADALAPAASPVIAAYSLGIAQVAGFLLGGLTTALMAAVLIARVEQGRGRLAPGVRLLDLTASTAQAPTHRQTSAARRAGAPRRRAVASIVAVAVVLAAALGTAAIATLQQLAQTPRSSVLAHRGFSEGGVENTIAALDAAQAAGADLVEMDVMQTKDGEFVAMHDASLSRLAGRDEAVKDLTLDELTDITVHDRFGHSGRIPSFSEYAAHAKRIGMPLLIEIKLGGGETADHVDRLVAELERLDALDINIYHSLDAPSVARLKQLRPDLTVGYTMAFAAVAAPDTPADFIVVEEWTATERVQRSAEAAGLGFMAWTVNDEAGIHELLRRGVDGIITDHPDAVLDARTGMQQETGLTDVLVDALRRFVTVV